MAKRVSKNDKDKTKVTTAKTTKGKTAAKKTVTKVKTAAAKTGTTSKGKATQAKRKTSKATATESNYTTPISVKEALKKMKGYGKRDLAKFKKVILAKREEIINQLQELKEQMMDSSTGKYVNENSPYSLHMAEQGTDAQEREKLYLWAQRENKFLGYLDDALQRIENGTYGICIDSINDPDETPHLVPKERLLAVPHTQHCVACKMKNNKKR